MPDEKRSIMDIVAGIFLIVCAVIIYFDSANIKLIALTALDASFFPRFLAVITIALSIIMILRAAANLKRSAKQERPQLQFFATVQELLPALTTLGLLGGYVFLIEPVGFLLTTPFYIFGQACVLAPKGERKPLMFAALGVLATIAIYCVFKFGFQLLVPMGLVG